MIPLVMVPTKQSRRVLVLYIYCNLASLFGGGGDLHV